MSNRNADVQRYFGQVAPTYDAESNRRMARRRGRFLRDQVQGRTLDVGIGPGQLALQYAQGPLVGVDGSRGMLLLARQRLPGAGLAVADAERLPFRSGVFDTVVCSEVIYYLSSPTAFLAEAARVLAPRGRLIVLWGNRRLNALYGLATALGLRPHDPFALRTPSRAEFAAWLDEALPGRPWRLYGFGWNRPLDRLLAWLKLDFCPIHAVVLDVDKERIPWG